PAVSGTAVVAGFRLKTQWAGALVCPPFGEVLHAPRASGELDVGETASGIPLHVQSVGDVVEMVQLRPAVLLGQLQGLQCLTGPLFATADVSEQTPQRDHPVVGHGCLG